MNPLYSQFNNNPFSQIISQAKQLQHTMKNPQQEVQRLLNSGQMSQEQFNQFAQIANNIRPMIK
jgi:hypothetical protein